MFSFLRRYWQWWILEGIVNAPGFLATDLHPSSSAAAKFGQELGRRACRAQARAEVVDVVGAALWGYLCNPYLDSINEGPTDPGEILGPPFTGGQCSALYRVDFTAQQIVKSTGAVNNTQTSWSLFNGPILGTIECEFGSCGIPGLPTPAYASWIVSGSLSASGETSGMQKVTIGDRRYILQGFSGSDSSLRSTLQINSVTIQSGTDNCGDPPGSENPPTYPPNLPPLDPPTTDPPGFDIDWDVDVDVNGDIIFCIGGECGEPEDPFPPLDPTNTDPPGGPGVPTGPPQDTDPDSPTPHEVSGCLDTGKILTGLKVTILDYDSSVGATQGVFRRVAWIWMGPGADLLDLVVDGANLESGQFILPDTWDCTCWKVRSNPGFRLRIQPYARNLVTE